MSASWHWYAAGKEPPQIETFNNGVRAMERGALVISRKVGQRMLIGDGIEVEVRSVKGHVVRLVVRAPKDVRLLRGELKEAA